MSRKWFFRLPAFTVLELTLAMLISAVVLGIAYSGYSLVSKSYSRYQNRNEKLATLARLDELLKKDFYKADYIGLDSSGIRFVKDSILLSGYSLIPHGLIRRSGIIDSFKVEIPDFISSFEGDILNRNIIPIGLNKEDARIDELSIKLIFESDTIPFHYLKKYSSLDLIHRIPHALH